jgi:mono/diheme cytochrome c family protein
MVKFLTYLLGFFAVFLLSCTGDRDKNHNSAVSSSERKFYNGIGVGPVKNIILGNSIDSAMAVNGHQIFQSKCIACHKLSDEKLIGPGLYGITKRRKPEWILNQILNPIEMTQKDSLAKELLSIYLAQMTDMNLSEQNARDILEYFRMEDSKSTTP